jgi:hypothetical protein
MNSYDKSQQLEIYGRTLAGSETENEKEAIARAQYLKIKLRRLLELENIGDLYDIAADVNKSILLGVGILSGTITEKEVVDRYKAYVQDQVALYGGPKAIMDKLEANAVPLAKWLAKLGAAKVALAAAKDVEEILKVEIDVPAITEVEPSIEMEPMPVKTE